MEQHYYCLAIYAELKWLKTAPKWHRTSNKDHCTCL
jgi:hypothetical protein